MNREPSRATRDQWCFSGVSEMSQDDKSGGELSRNQVLLLSTLRFTDMPGFPKALAQSLGCGMSCLVYVQCVTLLSPTIYAALRPIWKNPAGKRELRDVDVDAGAGAGAGAGDGAAS